MQILFLLRYQPFKKTLHLVLLSIATAGIYPLVWMFINTNKVESITSKKIADNTFLIGLAVCLGLSSAFSGSGNDAIAVVAGILSLSSLALYIIWAFRAKAALQEYALTEHKIDLKMNGFYTFLLTIYYINYCVNNLAEEQRKKDVLTGQSTATGS